MRPFNFRRVRLSSAIYLLSVLIQMNVCEAELQNMDRYSGVVDLYKREYTASTNGCHYVVSDT